MILKARMRNTQNRGKSGYVRISWDEALDIVAGEIKRIKDTYGPKLSPVSPHPTITGGLLDYKMGPFYRFLNCLGFTFIFDNPDSWEGFHWGAVHTYGFYWRLGCPEPYDLLEDTLKNAEMVVYWSNDPYATWGTYCGGESQIWRLWTKEAGIKQVFIDPFCNYTAATIGDKWLAPKVGTDSALALAIAYVWLKDE